MNKWQQLRSRPAFKWLTNRYVLISIGFVIWMLFLDTHSYMIHRSLNVEMSKMEADIDFYETELSTMRVELNELHSNPEAFEKYAREKFWMHRKGEHIVLVESRKQ